MTDVFKQYDVVKLENGKYELRRMNNHEIVAFRHGQPWRIFEAGDKLMGAIFDQLWESLQ